jgi:hypothetical protein
MITVLKRAILRSLEQRGYVLLRKAQYDGIVAAAALPLANAPAPATTQATTAPPPVSAAPPTPPPATPTPPLPPSPVREFATDLDLRAEFESVCRRLQGKLTLPINHALAIHRAVRHLTRARNSLKAVLRTRLSLLCRFCHFPNPVADILPEGRRYPSHVARNGLAAFNLAPECPGRKLAIAPR